MKTELPTLRLTHTEFADFYTELCDVIYRNLVGGLPDDGLHHTSQEARLLAFEIVDRLADASYLEYR